MIRTRIYWERYLRNRAGRLAEAAKYGFVRPKHDQTFYVVSCERNAASAALGCLDSVYRQGYDRQRVRHVVIDDASTDGTHDLICRWLEEHPGHSVQYTHNSRPLGGTANTVRAFRAAPPESVVVELNGDDRLADRYVLRFLNKVYADEEVWCTYNTKKHSNRRSVLSRPIPQHVIDTNTFREATWESSHPRTFRASLFSHIRDETLIDPETGEYWARADDQAYFLAMLELAGGHSRHLYRISYVYSRADSDGVTGQEEFPSDCARRIRLGSKYQPLKAL